MKITNLIPLAALLFAFSNLTAQQNFRLVKYDLTIIGTSTLHDWETKANDVKVTGSWDNQGQLNGIQSLNVTIPVEKMKSSKGSIMDGKTYKALKSDKNPNITFQLTGVKAITPTAKGYQLKTAGYLTIAGTKKLIDLTVDGEKLADGSIRFTGSKALKMTEYNVDPPVAMLGTLKTADDVTIEFSLTLAN